MRLVRSSIWCLFMFGGLTLVAPSAHAGWADSEISDIIDRVNETKANVDEIVANVRSGVGNLNQNIRDAVKDAVEDLKQGIERQIAGRADFLGAGNACDPGSPCHGFRSDMKNFLTNLENLTNALFSMTPAEVDIDMQQTIDLIDLVPGRALFPLYRTMGQQTPLFESDFVDRIADLEADLQLLAEGLQDAPASSADLRVFAAGATPPRDARLDGCHVILENADVFSTASLAVSGFGGAFKLIGKGLIAAGETNIKPGAGIHGYPHLVVSQNTRRQVGSALDGIGDLLFAISGYASNKSRYCTLQRFHVDLLNGQDEIKDKLDVLLETQLEIAISRNGRAARIGVMFNERIEEVCSAAEDALLEPHNLGPKLSRTTHNLITAGRNAQSKGDPRAYDLCRRAFRRISRK